MKLLLLFLLCVSSVQSQGFLDYEDEVVVLILINNLSLIINLIKFNVF